MALLSRITSLPYILLLLTLSAQGQSVWTPVGNEDFTGIAEPSEGRFIVTSSDGKIILSKDSGAHWKYARLNSQDSWNTLAFRDAHFGIAAGTEGRVSITVDGGESWSMPTKALEGIAFVSLFTDKSLLIGGDRGVFLSNRDGVGFKQVCFAPIVRGLVSMGDICIAATGRGILLRSTNAGSSWDTCFARSDLGAFYSICKGDGILAVGAGGYGLKSSDSGRSWEQIYVPVKTDLEAVCAQDSAFVVMTAGNKIFKTPDAGKTWQRIELKVYFPIAFITAATGISGNALVVGTSGTILLGRSNDSLAWDVLAHSPMTHELNYPLYWSDVCVVDTNRIYVVGPDERILHSSDGGVTWRSSVGPGGVGTLTAIHFFSASHGVALGDFGNLIETTDSGRTWLRPNRPVYQSFWDLAEVDSSYILIVSDSVLYKVSRDLTRWRRVLGSDSSHFKVIARTKRGTFLLAGSRLQNREWIGLVFRSTDAGETWNLQLESPTDQFPTIAVDDMNGVVLIGGSYGRLAASVDDGVSWSYSQTPMTRHIAGIMIDTLGVGYIGGQYFNLWRTSDNGETWSKELPLGSDDVFAWRAYGKVQVLNSTTYIVPGSGTIMRKSRQLPGSSSVRTTWSPDAYLYVRLYPNPSLDHVQVTIDGLYYVNTLPLRVVMFDMLGRAVQDLTAVARAQLSGSRTEFRLNTDGLSAGVYTLQVSTGSYTRARRFVVQ